MNLKQDSLRSSTVITDDTDKERMQSELTHAHESIEQLRQEVKRLRAQVAALREELAMSQFPFVYKPVKLADVKRVWRTQALERYVLNVDHHRIPPPHDLRDLFTKSVGSYVDAAGNKYTGELIGGVASGVGLLEFANGDRFEGEFVNGMMHGTGTYTSPSQGYSSRERRSLNSIEGLVQTTFFDGRTKVGPWVDGKGVGVHKWVRPTGEVDFTEYRNSQIDGVCIAYSPAHDIVSCSRWDRQVKLGCTRQYALVKEF